VRGILLGVTPFLENLRRAVGLYPGGFGDRRWRSHHPLSLDCATIRSPQVLVILGIKKGQTGGSIHQPALQQRLTNPTIGEVNHALVLWSGIFAGGE